MRLVLHPKVYSDIDEIMGYYERVATPGLAEEFYTELRYFMTKAADKPESFSIREGDIRRANLRRFPYHFLFRVVGHEVRILVVRHQYGRAGIVSPAVVLDLMRASDGRGRDAESVQAMALLG